MPKKNQLGVINLQGIFSAAAEDLLAQVGKGHILLRTHNIREAGAPLESAVRDLFSRLLPSGFRVRHGYLYDTTSTCTPQIDLIISAADRSQVMLEAPDGGTYSAVTDAYAVAEIKSSTTGLKSHLAQFANQVAKAREMRQAVRGWEQRRIPDLIPFMIVGSTVRMSMTTLRNHWAAHPNDRPDYILLLDQGRIVMPWNMDLAEIGMQPPAEPHLAPDGLDIGIFELGETPEARRGNALLWLYYAVLHRLRASQALELEQALRWMAPDNDSWLAAPKKTAEALSSVADPFAAAMTRSFQLKLVKQIQGKKTR